MENFVGRDKGDTDSITLDMRNLEKISDQIHDRTADQIERQANKILQAVTTLEENRGEWRTTAWKTTLPPYLIGVFLTFWVLMMAVHLTFPKPQATSPENSLQTFGLKGVRVTRGLGGLGRVINLPQGVELTNCPIPNPGGSGICIKTSASR